MANIVPVFKKGKKEDPVNYWPVSLTSVPDKIWRILGIIVKHLKDNTLIGHRKHGFIYEWKVLLSQLNLPLALGQLPSLPRKENRCGAFGF